MGIYRRLVNTPLELIIQDPRALVLIDTVTKERAVIFLPSLISSDSDKRFAVLKTHLRNAVDKTVRMGAAEFVIRAQKAKVGDVELDYSALVEFERTCKELERIIETKFVPEYSVPRVLKDALTVGRCDLSDMLDIDVIRDDLIASAAIPRSSMEDIDRPGYTRGHKVSVFLDHMDKRTLKDLEEFIHILSKRGFDTLVNKLLTDNNLQWFVDRWAV